MQKLKEKFNKKVPCRKQKMPKIDNLSSRWEATLVDPSFDSYLQELVGFHTISDSLIFCRIPEGSSLIIFQVVKEGNQQVVSLVRVCD